MIEQIEDASDAPGRIGVFGREQLDDIDLKILDILQEDIQIKASVVWLHRWIEGPHQPGCGLNFDRSTVPHSLGHFLADSFFKKR
jgi:hypothetical protein